MEDANYILDYFRRTADNRILYGCGIGYGGRDPAILLLPFAPNLVKTFPQLANVRIDFAWSGNFAPDADSHSACGAVIAPHLFFHGDSGHG